MALRDLGADFETCRISEWNVYANRSYKAILNPEDKTDYSKNIEKFKWLARILYEKGISVDGVTQLTKKEIMKRGETWCRNVYNEFKANRNIGSITNRNGIDLNIVDTDKFVYIMTYSFPCQDLSVAGKQRGMSKCSGTRSGLLWEVERLLNETEHFPQVLIMENVTQVHSSANILDFQKWIDFLSSKGYSNYWQDLNAKNYGVAQNRDRTFMVSLLGDWNYKFPQPIPLEKKMKDYLEDEVEEKYYINTEKARKLIDTLNENGTIKSIETVHMNYTRIDKFSDVAKTIMARDYKGFNTGFDTQNGVIEKDKIGNIEINPLNTMPDGSCRTIKSQYHKNSVQNFESESTYGATGVIEKIKIKQATKEGYIECNVGGVADLSYPESKTRRGRVQDNGECCPTLTATETGVCKIESMYSIRKLTPRECWRLMNFSDEDFQKAEKVNSNSQLYKQAGNSIVENVLVAILGQLIPGKEDVYKHR